jgi:hypothetical protein
VEETYASRGECVFGKHASLSNLQLDSRHVHCMLNDQKLSRYMQGDDTDVKCKM